MSSSREARPGLPVDLVAMGYDTIEALDESDARARERLVKVGVDDG